MSVNFGMNGMMNGMNYGMGGMNQMYGSGGGNVFRQLKEEYGCEDCFHYGPVPPNYQMHVRQVPMEVAYPSVISKFMRFFFLN